MTTRARIRRLEACEEIKERGLAGAVGADDPHELSRGHLEGYVVVGDEASEALGHSANVQQHPLSPSGGEGRVRGVEVRGTVHQPVRRRPRWASAMMPPGWITEMTMIRKP